MPSTNPAMVLDKRVSVRTRLRAALADGLASAGSLAVGAGVPLLELQAFAEHGGTLSFYAVTRVEAALLQLPPRPPAWSAPLPEPMPQLRRAPRDIP